MMNSEWTDLAAGQGEWKNMQEIVIKTFRFCVENIKNHSDQIAILNTQLVVMKEELQRRPTWPDIEKMLEMKSKFDKNQVIRGFSVPSVTSHGADINSSIHGEVDYLKLQLAQLKAECEKRVTIQSFKSSLDRKMDKSDILQRDISKFSLKDYTDDLGKLKLEVQDLKGKIENQGQKIEEEMKLAAVRNSLVDISVLKVQLDRMWNVVNNDCCTRDYLDHKLESKVSSFFEKNKT